MWAIAALAGWALLRDQAQQTLALLLVPAWMLSEFGYHADGHIGEWTYDGTHPVCVGSSLPHVFCGLTAQGCAGHSFCGVSGRINYGRRAHARRLELVSLRIRLFCPSVCVLGVDRDCRVPLVVAAFHGHKGLIPIAAAIVLTIALPWCYIVKTRQLQLWPWKYLHLARHHSKPGGTCASGGVCGVPVLVGSADRLAAAGELRHCGLRDHGDVVLLQRHYEQVRPLAGIDRAGRAFSCRRMGAGET